MLAKIYIPLFSSPSYVEQIKNEIERQKTQLNEEKFQELLKLHRLAKNLAWSIRQLQGKGVVFEPKGLRSYEAVLTDVIERHLKKNIVAKQDILYLKNELSKHKYEMTVQSKGWSTTISVLNLISTSLISLVAVGGVALGLTAMCTGGWGIAFLGLVFIAMSLIVLAACLYSAYVEGRYLAGQQQFTDIENVLDIVAPSAEVDPVKSTVQLDTDNNLDADDDIGIDALATSTPA